MPPPSTPARFHLIAGGLYAALSVLLLDHGASLTRNVLGVGSDPFAMIWFLSWWPFAWTHHLHPLYTNLAWQTVGVQLGWMTSMPLLGLLAWPVTVHFGGVLAYNFLAMLAPAMAAFSAYGLCLFVTRIWSAALLCGFAYGFSTFEMSVSLEHLNLSFNAAIPCLVVIVLARLADRLGRGAAVLLFAVILVMQFYTSMEVTAAALFFGFLAWIMALCMLPAKRPALLRLAADGALAGVLSTLLASPILWNIATTQRLIQIPNGWPYMTTARLFNMLVTTPSVVFVNPDIPANGNGLFGLIAQHDYSTGLPLLLIVAWYFRKRLGVPEARFLLGIFMVILLASLGPQLWAGTHFTRIVLPWRMMLAVPLIQSALPVRFEIFSNLILALILSMWIAQNPARPGRSWRIAAAAAAWGITLAPPHPVQAAPYAAFFRPGEVQAALGPAARVLILPGLSTDHSSFWQAENHFGFAQSQGYLGMPPAAMLAYPAVRDMIVAPHNPELGQEIAALCQATKTQFVIAGPGADPDIVTQVENLGWPKRQIDDVIVFTVPVHG